MGSTASGAAAAATSPPDASDTAPGFRGALFWVAVAFSVFQIVTAAFSPLSSSVVRAVHVGFLLLVTFVLFPPLGRRGLGWVVGAAAFAAGLYHWSSRPS